MSYVRRVVVALCLSAIATAPAVVAQERIELIRSVGPDKVFQEYDVGFTRFGELRNATRLPASQAGGGSWVPLAGGRYLVGIHQSHPTLANPLIAFDRRTRSIVATLPTPFPVIYLIADPVRPRVFYSNGLQVVGFDASTLSSWTISSSAAGVFSRIVYAHKVDRLYMLTTPTFGDPTIIPMVTVVNATSGSLVNQFRTTIGSGPMVVDAGGQRLYKTVEGPTPFTTEIAAYDPQTGQEVARSATSPAELTLDEPRGQLLATVNGEEVTILDATSLTTIQQVSIPPLSGPGNPRLSLRPGRLMSAAHVIQGTVTSGICWKQAITTFNIDGGSRGTIDLSTTEWLLPPGVFLCGEVVLLEAPPSPSAPAASVVGSNVQVTWENPGNVGEFELQVGFAPNAPVLSQRVGLATSIAFATVPPGTYYLRVRAINEIGTSPASPEIQVVVH